METAVTCFFCGRIPAKLGHSYSYFPLSSSSSFGSFCLLTRNNVNNTIKSTRCSLRMKTQHRVIQSVTNSSETKLPSRRRRRKKSEVVTVEKENEIPNIPFENKKDSKTVHVHLNGDPIGWKDVGKSVVKWIREGMRAMANDFASAELEGEVEFLELRQRMGPGLTFVIQAQPYLNAVPMPLGLEVMCLKACTHYPTLFDHFQRDLRDVLQDMQSKSLIDDWTQTQSWKLLKELANSGFFSLLNHIDMFYC